MNKAKLRTWGLITAIIAALIFLQSALPAGASRTESGGILAFVQSILPWMTHTLLRKLAHFGEYFLLGFAVSKAFRHARNYMLIKPLAFSALIAQCDETLQLFIPGRSGEITDVWVDFSGALIASLLVWLFFKLRRK